MVLSCVSFRVTVSGGAPPLGTVFLPQGLSTLARDYYLQGLSTLAKDYLPPGIINPVWGLLPISCCLRDQDPYFSRLRDYKLSVRVGLDGLTYFADLSASPLNPLCYPTIMCLVLSGTLWVGTIKDNL